MKVMAILGSPRRLGNSSMLATRFLTKASEKGAETRSFFLEGMNYKGCKACGACKKTSDRCVIKDDVSEVLEEMFTADIIIFAMPNYFADLSGQFKLFLDRTYSLLAPEFLTSDSKSRLPSGKHLVFIITQGAPESAFKSLPEKYAHLKGYYNLAGFHVVRGCGLYDCGEIEGHPELLKQIDSLVEQLVK